jgi:hypothetical protein
LQRSPRFRSYACLSHGHPIWWKAALDTSRLKTSKLLSAIAIPFDANSLRESFTLKSLWMFSTERQKHGLNSTLYVIFIGNDENMTNFRSIFKTFQDFNVTQSTVCFKKKDYSCYTIYSFGFRHLQLPNFIRKNMWLNGRFRKLILNFNDDKKPR